MRVADLVSMAFRGLFEQKLRTALTLLGVVIGAVLIILSLAVGEGMQEEVARQFNLGDRLRRLDVFPGRGDVDSRMPPELLEVKAEMSDAKRKRIRKAIVRHWQRNNARPKVPLDGEMLRKLEKIPHVATVEPDVSRWCSLLHENAPLQGEVRGVALRHAESVAKQIVAGRFFSGRDDRELLVHEYLAYQWGYTGDDDVKKLLGESVRIEIRVGGGVMERLVQIRSGGDVKLSRREARTLEDLFLRFPRYADRLPLSEKERAVLKKAFQPRKKSRPIVITAKFRIVGVFRDPDEEPSTSGRRRRRLRSQEFRLEATDAALPLRTAEDFVRRTPGLDKRGFFRATVIVDRNENVEEVVDQIKALKLNTFALSDILARVQLNIQVITYVMAVLAGVALFVAALGIANTMVMTVLERTHEIGVMKALGACDGDIQRIFLLEGALIGLLGGLLGLLTGWAASLPINAYVVQRLERDFREPIGESIFVFPWWLVVGVPLFASLITMLASLYPARRAAKIDPIQALRHE
ncbi:MAG: ABC transporter permease [Planctomycetaceae bacterium]